MVLTLKREREKLMKSLIFALVACLCLTGLCSSAPSVTITHVDPHGNCGSYYEAVLDYDGSDSYETHYEMGQLYAQAILDVYDGIDFERSYSTFIRYSVMNYYLNGIGYNDFIDRASDFIDKFDDPGDEFYLYGAEIEGMASVLNSDENGHTGGDYIYYFFFKENELSLKEIFMINMLSDVFASNGCSSLSAWGELTPSDDPMLDGGPIVGKNTDFSIGSPTYGTLGKLTSMHAVHYFKNQGSKKDMITLSILGSLLPLEKGMNEDGLFVGENLSRYRQDHYESAGKDPVTAVLRAALETCTTVGEAQAVIMENRFYSHGNLITVADQDHVEIVENSYLGSDSRMFDSELRTDPIGVITDPDTNPPEVWDYNVFEGPVLAATNSFQLPSQPENHWNSSMYRLGTIKAMMMELDDDGEITQDDIMEVLTQNRFSYNNYDMFRDSLIATIQSMIYDTRRQTLKVHFAPCPFPIQYPWVPDYADIDMGFLNAPEP